MSTEETNIINEKKEKETKTTSSNFKNFITNYLLSIIITITIIIFIIGNLGLYTTKIAQSNILPDNIELAPYTIFDRIVKDNPIDINIMRPSLFSENNNTLSQKVIFNSQEYLDSFNKSFLCSIKKNAEPNSGVFANAALFFSNVYENIIAKNFWAINNLFLYFSYLPESVIMILYGFFGIFIWFGLYFFNLCISIFYHIVNIPQLFRTSNENNNNQWESEKNISFVRIVKLILFIFLWIPIGSFSAFLMPPFFTLYGLISPLFATYKINQNQNKSFGVIDFIKDAFIYKKFLFFVLATISLFYNGIKYLGQNAVIGIVIAVIFAYIMGLYNNEMPENNINGFSFKIKQNITQAEVANINLKDPKIVKICQPIPVDDEKIENIIKNVKPRPLTKVKLTSEENNNNNISNNNNNNNNNINNIQQGGKKIKPLKKYNIRFT